VQEALFKRKIRREDTIKKKEISSLLDDCRRSRQKRPTILRQILNGVTFDHAMKQVQDAQGK